MTITMTTNKAYDQKNWSEAEKSQQNSDKGQDYDYETDEQVIQSSKSIDLSTLRQSANRTLATGLIAPAVEDTSVELAEEHAAEPIKSLDDIYRISEYLIQNGRYRDNMLFIVGINFGLRVSDLRVLRFSDIINDNCTFKESFPVFEIKTRNTRARKMNRYITINTAVIEAVTLYLENTPNVKLSDYMFRSESNRCTSNKPMTRQSVDRVLKGLASDVGITSRVSTHSLRKTFGYHQMVMSGNDNRKLMLLQKMFNHSSPAQTLSYIGITNEEIQEAYKSLNLGSRNHSYLVESSLYEAESTVV